MRSDYFAHRSAAFLLLVSVSLYALDQVTKWAAKHAIPLGDRITVIPDFFFLVHAHNTGASFGMLSGNNGFFIGLSALALAAMAYFWKHGAFRAQLHAIGGAFLIAGILGNLTSRLVDGYVTDFLLFDLHLPFASPWPAFNIADCCICVAAFLFVLPSIFGDRDRFFEGIATWFRGISLFWRFQIAGWATFEILTFPLKVLILGSFQSALVVTLIRDGFAFLLTLAMRRIFQWLYREPRRASIKALVVGGACLMAGMTLTAFSLALENLIDSEQTHLFGDMAVFRLFYFCMSLYVGWGLLYVGIRLSRDAVTREIHIVQTEAARREAELKMLRSQMDPHFLFNALNAIRAGLGKHAQELIGLLDALAGYLRYSLAHRNDDLVPVEDEFDAMADYLAVEKARFRDELEVDCRIESAARSLLAPGILLQPLVENAIKYGRQTSPIPLRVRVDVGTGQTGNLCVEVSNTGRWIERPPTTGVGGVGLGNLRHRLQLLYPNLHSLVTDSDGEWVTLKIEIPAES